MITSLISEIATIISAPSKISFRFIPKLVNHHNGSIFDAFLQIQKLPILVTYDYNILKLSIRGLRLAQLEQLQIECIYISVDMCNWPQTVIYRELFVA